MKKHSIAVYLLLFICMIYIVACANNNKTKTIEIKTNTTTIKATKEQDSVTHQKNSITTSKEIKKHIENAPHEIQDDLSFSKNQPINDTISLKGYKIYLKPCTKKDFKNGKNETFLVDGFSIEKPSEQFLKQEPAIKISGDSLEINTPQKKILFINKESSTEFIKYNIVASNVIKGYYLVFTIEMESYYHLLIHKETGTITKSYGIPVQITSHFYIAPNWDLEAGFTYNGFEFFTQNKEGILKPVGSHDPLSWGPESYSTNTKNEMIIKTGNMKTPFIKLTVQKMNK